VLITLGLVALLVGGAGLWLRAQQRQYALNRQLIAALLKNDGKQALALVKAGADPNTHYTSTPVPTLPELVNQFFYHSPPPPVNDSPTAFTIACGAEGVTMCSSNYGPYVVWLERPDNAQLVQAMLAHGATVNVKDALAWTPLDWAIFFDAPVKTIDLLLEHGANANVQDKDGRTPLMNGNDAIIRRLLKHGANPNLADTSGRTPLSIAKENNCPDIVALLEQYGAKK
jgi:hypothetical protein